MAATEQAIDTLLGELEQRSATRDRDTSGSLPAAEAVALFSDMATSRALDIAGRQLKADGRGYYTIASAGHEMNAVVGAALRPTDPAFLHYRSGGFFLARARRAGVDVVADVIRSFVAARTDPAAGGRHKVWGRRDLWVPPQTSTIGSHPPKAVGAAFTIGRAARLGHELPVPRDSVAVASFGDASANHATTLSAITAARYAHRRGNPLPLLLVVEDNGIGISVDTPPRWIERTFAGQPELRYVRADGDLDEVHGAVEGAVRACREARVPVLLHLPTVRLWGHAGSDVEATYRSLEDIEAAEARDPILRTARWLVETGTCDAGTLRDVLDDARDRVAKAVAEHADEPPLSSADEVVRPLAPYRVDVVAGVARGPLDTGARREVHGGELPEESRAATRRTLGGLLNAALHDEMLRRPEVIVFGEDVARKGGVYNVTAGLQRTFGTGRVFDTLLDETTILGVAQGAGLLDLLPVPEIQYLAYIHNALDQIRGEAASTSFFSDGAFRTPMVIRVASFAYQKGFGGHFHNDDSIGALRDIPGLVMAAPSRGADAVQMLRTCLAMAAEDGRVVTFHEPIALYHEKDLYEPGDGGYLDDYPEPGAAILPGEVGVYGDGTDCCIVTYANGVRMARRAARRLETDGLSVRVVDLRWLNPLPVQAVREHAEACDSVLVADECRATGGGIADAVIADLAENGLAQRVASVRSRDTFVPLGPAADLVLLSEDDIVERVRTLIG